MPEYPRRPSHGGCEEVPGKSDVPYPDEVERATPATIPLEKPAEKPDTAG